MYGSNDGSAPAKYAGFHTQFLGVVVFHPHSKLNDDACNK